MTAQLRDMIEWIDGTDKYIEQLLEKVELYKKIVIFGAGIGGMETLYLLQQGKCANKVIAFSDNNKDKIGKKYVDYPVIAPEEIPKTAQTALILISSTAYNVIFKQLVQLGVDKQNIMYFQPAGISLQKANSDVKFIRDNIEKFEQVFEMLEDDRSKKIYKCILNYRVSKNIKWLQEIEECVDSEAMQYFDRNILKPYHFEKGFVDGGAYIGDTLERFFDFRPNWSGTYYCIEAGKILYKKMCDTVETLSEKNVKANVKTYNYALWDSVGTLCFDTASFGGGAGSRVSNSGECVKCITLDTLLKEKKIDFIKMDIEGAEKKALVGAQNIIKKNKPILAICIYHRPEDFFEIPLLIKNFLPDEYRFYVRQYRFGQSETVLYAMPKVRKG